MELEQRISDLRKKLDASEGPDGKPIKGYTKRHRAIKAELAKLTALPLTPADPA